MMAKSIKLSKLSVIIPTHNCPQYLSRSVDYWNKINVPLYIADSSEQRDLFVSDKQGIIHCCKGKPISIRRLVEEHIVKRNAKIKLNLGYFPYNEYEAMAFWGGQ